MIKLNNISHSYGAKPALHDLTLNVEANQLTCLLGDSGCGKTTILRLIAGLEIPQSGQITIENKTVTENKQILIPPYQRNIGFIFQDLALWPHFTVYKNIAFGLTERKEGNIKDTVFKMLNFLLCGTTLKNIRINSREGKSNWRQFHAHWFSNRKYC